MIAAIYARKSRDETGADADPKSVARQIENARTFAAAKGWTVAAAHVYSDDAISGSAVQKLRGRQRLLDIIGARPPFQVLILRDAWRFSRCDGDAAFAELKAIARAVVAIWYYSDGQQFIDDLDPTRVLKHCEHTFVTLQANPEVPIEITERLTSRRPPFRIMIG
jgi:DNA invertase Pin-like site-specific DNA recombinase